MNNPKKLLFHSSVLYEKFELFYFFAEPGSVATLRNWEIRWAKPINGSSKILERQNSIDEAVAKGQRCDVASTGPKKRAANKRSKKKNPEVPSTSECSEVDYRRFLEIFVSENFGAVCQFECQSTAEYGHVCKVNLSIRRNWTKD